MTNHPGPTGRERKWPWRLFPLVLFLVGATGYGAERLVIISPHWEGLRYEFGRAFAAWHQQHHGSAVEIDWRDLGGTSDDLRFVVGEFKQRPDGIGIDLFFGGGIDPFYDLAGRGLLQSYRPPETILAQIPKELGGVPVYDPEYRWFGAALSGFGILYNKRVLQLNQWPLVETWRDLADRAPLGSVGSGDPRSSGSTHMVYELILQRYGWDEGWAIITKLAARVRSFDRASSSTAKDVATGNTAYALTIDFYAQTQIAAAGADNVGFVLPADCIVVNPDGLAILRGAPHLTVAQRFVEFAISEAGQKLLMLPRGHAEGAQKFSIERMSILPQLYDRYRAVSLVAINPFELQSSFRYDPGKGGARWNVLNGLMGATIIEVQPELVRAWKAVKHDAPAIRELGRPVITEEEALRVAATDWQNPVRRQRLLGEWQRAAHRKYETLAAQHH